MKMSGHQGQRLKCSCLRLNVLDLRRESVLPRNCVSPMIAVWRDRRRQGFIVGLIHSFLHVCHELSDSPQA
jgi:hypothetical protein